MRLQEWGKRLLGIDTGEEYEDLLYQEVYQGNVFAAKILIPCIAALQLYNIFRIFFLSEVKLASVRNSTYFTLYLLMITVCISTAFLLYRKRESPRGHNRIWCGYGIFFVFWHLVINFMDMQRSDNLNVFLLSLLIFATIFFVRPWQGLVVTFTAIGVFLVLFTFQNGGITSQNLGDYTNSISFGLIALFLCYLHYQNRVKNAQNKYLILRQNEEITWMNHQLGQLAQTDFLSGLYNRRFLDRVGESRLRQSAQYGEGIALMMLDIDDFKQYNDNYGHRKGDEAIQKLSQILRSNLKNPRDLAVRYGGEEFTLILCGVTKNEARERAQSICRSLLEEKIGHGFSGTGIPYLTVSIGVFYQVPTPDSSLEECFQRADAALYCAKREGKNRVCLGDAHPS